jgi:hypothetical protein
MTLPEGEIPRYVAAVTGTCSPGILYLALHLIEVPFFSCLCAKPDTNESRTAVKN